MRLSLPRLLLIFFLQRLPVRQPGECSQLAGWSLHPGGGRCPGKGTAARDWFWDWNLNLLQLPAAWMYTFKGSKLGDISLNRGDKCSWLNTFTVSWVDSMTRPLMFWILYFLCLKVWSYVAFGYVTVFYYYLVHHSQHWYSSRVTNRHHQLEVNFNLL